jgi:hypothetical protein
VTDHNGGVMVSVFTSREEDCGWSLTNKTKDLYKIGIHSFAAKHTAYRSKSKDWLAQNQDHVSELSNMSTQGLFSPIIVFFCVMFCRSLSFVFSDFLQFMVCDYHFSIFNLFLFANKHVKWTRHW